MIDNEEARKNGWTVSETNPGYLTKTMKYKNCAIIINRPILTPEEQKKREEEVGRGLSFALRDYVWRKRNYDVKVDVDIEPKK